jgi:tRNA-splicing endonuclease subunit Sen54
MELLPEEALYLLERGSLQIWYGPSAQTVNEVEAGVGEWCDEEYGVKAAMEMSVLEGFATFIGQDNLTWERYQVGGIAHHRGRYAHTQAYSYLKRLGYTVQRTRPFVPSHFTDPALQSGRISTPVNVDALPPFRTWWTQIPTLLSSGGHIISSCLHTVFWNVLSIAQSISGHHHKLGRHGSILPFWHNVSYGTCRDTGATDRSRVDF